MTLKRIIRRGFAATAVLFYISLIKMARILHLRQTVFPCVFRCQRLRPRKGRGKSLRNIFWSFGHCLPPLTLELTFALSLKRNIFKP